jgi:putative PEP-CTERM system histidine kinase
LLTEKEWIVVLDEDHAEEVQMVPEALRRIERAWLITPLLHDRQLAGFVLLLSPKAPMQLNWENMDLLKTSGRQAASYLNLSQAAEELAEAKQFEGFNRLSAFVIHDLKNIIAQLSLLTRNAVKHKQNPAFVDDAMATIENAVGRMNRLLVQLDSSRSGAPASRADLVQAAQEAVLTQSSQMPVPVLHSTEDFLPVGAESDRLVSVLSHIIQNAQDATPAEGRIQVFIESTDNEAVVRIQDTGEGMSEEFIRDYLFKPFHTTKGLTGMGIGAYECKEFVRSLGGHVEVESTPGQGSTFSLFFPILSDEESRKV